MKLITISLTDEEHTKIKVAAARAGVSMKYYLLSGLAKDVVEILSEAPAPAEKPLKPRSLKEKVALEAGVMTPEEILKYRAKNLCEHGQTKGQCFVKGCKFGRYKK